MFISILLIADSYLYSLK